MGSSSRFAFLSFHLSIAFRPFVLVATRAARRGSSLSRFTALRSPLPLSTRPLSRVLSNSPSSSVPFYSRTSVSLPPTVLVCAALWMVVSTHLERAAQSAATHKPVSWLSDSSHFPGRRKARRTRTERTINGGFPGSIPRDSQRCRCDRRSTGAGCKPVVMPSSAPKGLPYRF